VEVVVKKMDLTFEVSLIVLQRMERVYPIINGSHLVSEPNQAETT